MKNVLPGRCNNTALKKASRKLTHLYDNAIAPTGLKSTQLSILFEIDRWGDTPPNMRELAAALVMDRSTLGQNLRPLERDGFVTLAPNPDDARSKCVVLTEAGNAKTAEAAVLWQQVQKKFESVFGAEEAAALRTILLTLATSNEL